MNKIYLILVLLVISQCYLAKAQGFSDYGLWHPLSPQTSDFMKYGNTPDPTDYMAVTTNAICLDENALIWLMLTRSSTLTETEIMAVHKMEREVICEQASMDNNITTPIFNLCMSIKSVFNGIDDLYDPARHSIKLNLVPGIDLRKTAASIKT